MVNQLSWSPAPSSRRILAVALVALLAAACGSGAAPHETSDSPSSLASEATPSMPRTAPSLAVGLPSPAAIASPTLGPVAAESPTPGPSNAASGSAPASRTVAAVRKAFRIDLFRPGAFVSEARTDWCVPAAIESMALMDGASLGSLPSQAALDRRSRALSSSRLVGAGSEPQGWAGVLNRLGHGPYRVVTRRTFGAAVAAAARAIRVTRRPVGLLVWHGAHAWVMSGFTATADPARSRAFRVTSVRISDPWYPRARGAYGPTHRPDSRISLAELARNFLPWHRPVVRYAELDGRFVLVLPGG